MDAVEHRVILTLFCSMIWTKDPGPMPVHNKRPRVAETPGVCALNWPKVDLPVVSRVPAAVAVSNDGTEQR